MARVLGIERLQKQFQAQSLKGRVRLTAVAGYAAPYAIYVHEDPFADHPIGKWKFLEDPLRRGRGYMGRLIKQSLRRKRSLADAVLVALAWLEQASKDEVPIDTGELHDSWFVRGV